MSGWTYAILAEIDLSHTYYGQGLIPLICEPLIAKPWSVGAFFRQRGNQIRITQPPQVKMTLRRFLSLKTAGCIIAGNHTRGRLAKSTSFDRALRDTDPSNSPKGNLIPKIQQGRAPYSA